MIFGCLYFNRALDDLILFSRSGNSITVISKDTIIVFMTWNKKSLFFFYCCQLEMVQLRITYNFFTLMYLSCSYIYVLHIFSTNLHTCSQNLIANCPVLGLVGMRGRQFSRFFSFCVTQFFWLDWTIFNPLVCAHFCRVLTLHYIWHFFNKMDMWNKNSGSKYKLASIRTIRPNTKQFQSVSISTFCQVLNLYLALQKKR